MICQVKMFGGGVVGQRSAVGVIGECGTFHVLCAVILPWCVLLRRLFSASELGRCSDAAASIALSYQIQKGSKW